jgi:UDP-glucuronate 4-epimerase
MTKILVTGAAGFIGYHLSERLLREGQDVYGIDSLNHYYDPSLKRARVENLQAPNFQFQKLDLQNYEGITRVFQEFDPDVVINLAAQAGVRYSLENPRSYIESNLNGFFNILEASKQHGVEKFIYASSSSVYGNNKKTPFAESDTVDHPVSLYAATKKSNELMAHTYSHLYQMNTIGLRFFTVYGPWGRPDMAYYFFTKAILEGKPIQLYNQGKNLRDYTYIDDIVESIRRIVANTDGLKPENRSNQYMLEKSPYYQLFNIGGSQSVPVLDFVNILEGILGIEAKKELVDFQPGDVFSTEADTRRLEEFTNFKPSISLSEGLSRFVEWYKAYYKI